MHKIIDRLARGFAQLGGATLCLLILIICASVIGRTVNGVLHSDVMQDVAPGLATWLLATGVGPINGDFEIVEAGMAFAIFAFLPICQLYGAHASVDVFMASAPEKFARWMRALVEVVFAAVLVLIAWQLFEGALSKYRTGQTTLLLEFPVWWSYAASVVAMTMAAITGVYVAWADCRDCIMGGNVQPSDPGA